MSSQQIITKKIKRKLIIEEENEAKGFFKCEDCSYWFNPEKDNMYILNYKHSHKNIMEERTLCSGCFDTCGESYKKDGWKCDDFEDESEEDDQDKAPKEFDLFDFLVAQSAAEDSK